MLDFFALSPIKEVEMKASTYTRDLSLIFVSLFLLSAPPLPAQEQDAGTKARKVAWGDQEYYYNIVEFFEGRKPDGSPGMMPINVGKVLGYLHYVYGLCLKYKDAYVQDQEGNGSGNNSFGASRAESPPSGLSGKNFRIWNYILPEDDPDKGGLKRGDIYIGCNSGPGTGVCQNGSMGLGPQKGHDDATVTRENKGSVLGKYDSLMGKMPARLLYTAEAIGMASWIYNPLIGVVNQGRMRQAKLMGAAYLKPRPPEKQNPPYNRMSKQELGETLLQAWRSKDWGTVKKIKLTTAHYAARVKSKVLGEITGIEDWYFSGGQDYHARQGEINPLARAGKDDGQDSEQQGEWREPQEVKEPGGKQQALPIINVSSPHDELYHLKMFDPTELEDFQDILAGQQPGVVVEWVRTAPLYTPEQALAMGLGHPGEQDNNNSGAGQLSEGSGNSGSSGGGGGGGEPEGKDHLGHDSFQLSAREAPGGYDYQGYKSTRSRSAYNNKSPEQSYRDPEVLYH